MGKMLHTSSFSWEIVDFQASEPVAYVRLRSHAQVTITATQNLHLPGNFKQLIVATDMAYRQADELYHPGRFMEDVLT